VRGGLGCLTVVSRRCAAAQTCLKKAGGWPALNGDPEWKLYHEQKLEPNLLLGGVWQELPIAVITKVAELEDNGGGFTNAGYPPLPGCTPHAHTQTVVLRLIPR
jgi:hypothetical protein